jgi:hypothetical protein
MMLTTKSGFIRSRNAAWTAGLNLALFLVLFLLLTLTLALCVGGLDPASARSRGSQRIDARSHYSSSGGGTISAPADRSEVRNYFMDFAGDHSLDVATVIEQPSAGYARYTVQLHLASGAEQSVIVAAPPGGLQVEMHDMTGDKVPNDIVLRPALIRWLPTVLVNDGHEHFEIAVASSDPSSFSSSENLGSRRRDTQTFALLMSSGFKAIHLPNSRRMFDPFLRECLCSPFSQTASNRLGHASSPGRAPPLVTLS